MLASYLVAQLQLPTPVCVSGTRAALPWAMSQSPKRTRPTREESWSSLSWHGAGDSRSSDGRMNNLANAQRNIQVGAFYVAGWGQVMGSSRWWRLSSIRSELVQRAAVCLQIKRWSASAYGRAKGEAVWFSCDSLGIFAVNVLSGFVFLWWRGEIHCRSMKWSYPADSIYE